MVQFPPSPCLSAFRGTWRDAFLKAAGDNTSGSVSFTARLNLSSSTLRCLFLSFLLRTIGPRDRPLGFFQALRRRQRFSALAATYRSADRAHGVEEFRAVGFCTCQTNRSASNQVG
jgi:hypothetical protein